MRRLRLALAGLAALLLAACGGGLWVSIDGGSDGEDPQVTATTAATSVAAGGVLRVAAAATDGDGIAQVWFYRLDGNAWTELTACHEEVQPYECDVPVPDDGRLTVQVRARAFDNWDNESDSNVVSVVVVR